MTITLTKVKQDISLIDNAINEDVIITKNNRPFAVAISAEKYDELLANQKPKKSIDNSGKKFQGKI